MNILIACDKFKGTLSADKVCKAIEKGVLTTFPQANCIIQPLADGGDGTLQILQYHFDFKETIVDTIDPLNRKISANYLRDQISAFIELATTSGIALLHKSELDVLAANTVGTGLLIRHALENDHKEIVLTLGGSCTNDVGLGIAYALGFEFLDKNNKSIIPSGGNLKTIQKIVPPKNNTPFKMTILCDVTNPLHGESGAAQVYGPQKGANQEQVILLDWGMIHIAELIEKTFGKAIDKLEGGGAAGGIAAGLFGLLDDVIVQNGFDYLADKLGLVDQIKTADYVITGEGKFDQTSLNGKVVGKMLDLCQKQDKPLIVISGSQEIENINSPIIFATDSIVNHAKDLDNAMNRTEFYLNKIGAELRLE